MKLPNKFVFCISNLWRSLYLYPWSDLSSFCIMYLNLEESLYLYPWCDLSVFRKSSFCISI